MHRSVVEDCLPWLLALFACCVALYLLLRWGGARLSLARLKEVHADERGAVQSLSFVLTVPIFVMVMMLIVQISQLMIGIVVVHYASFAAARAAVVWIPADTGGEEGENRVSYYRPGAENPIPGNGDQYTIMPGSPKYQKIEMAAVFACMPLAPSRDLGLVADGAERDALHKIYQGVDPAYETNSRIPARIDNKFAYSRQATRIRLQFLHKDDGIEPPLAQWLVPPDILEFYPNEVGWQDPIQVTVTHEFALLPGPGRLLARRETSYDGRTDEVAASIFARRGIYVRELTATTTLGNEGRKSVAPFRHHLQTPGAFTSSSSHERATRVLFIGNSYTSTNDLPGQFRTIAQASGIPVEVSERTAGGATLAQHADDAQTSETIAAGGWDYVVLQEQSLTPLFNRPGMFTAARQLHRQIEQAGAKTVLYMTWARENTPEAQAGLSSAYRELAGQLGAGLAPVGEAWQAIRTAQPKLQLYQPDGSHPSLIGTHLAACVLLAEILGVSPVGLPSDAIPMTADQAHEAQRIAWETAQGRNSRPQLPQGSPVSMDVASPSIPAAASREGASGESASHTDSTAPQGDG